MFPRGTFQRTRVELVDGQKGDTMVGWMNHEYGYVAGLGEWYKRHQLPAGARIRVERTKNPTVFVVDFQPRRMRREWVPVAGADSGSITFSMQKRPIACEYDEQMTMDHATPEQVDGLASQLRQEGRPLASIVREVVPELLKLSPAGKVHAKTVYSAVNVFMRTPPGPVFATLAGDPVFVDEGDGNWSIDESRG